MKEKSNNKKTNLKVNSLENMQIRNLTNQELEKIKGGCNSGNESTGIRIDLQNGDFFNIRPY